jgi:hypothetical protein
MSDVCGLSVEASRWQRFQSRLIELFAVARVPGARQDRHLARVRMHVWGELVSSGKLQAERIGAGLRRIPHQVHLFHACHRQAALRPPLHFRGRYCDSLRLGLGVESVNAGGKSQAAQQQSQSPNGHVTPI